MKKFLISFYLSIKKIIGLDLLIFLRSCIALPWFIRDYFKIKSQLKTQNIQLKFNLQLQDKFEKNGSLNSHYFHQDLFIAQKLFQAKAVKHLDIGSRVDGFVAHVATFREIETIDIRPQSNYITNINFVHLDIMNLPEKYHNYCDSISSLHAFEHFGLGRYGDPIQINGHSIALDNVYKMLKDNGIFYFSTPIGKMRIEFNAHRVFSVDYLINTLFHNKFIVESFAYVDDKGNLHTNVALTENDIIENYRCDYGCGIFCLRKVNGTTSLVSN